MALRTVTSWALIWLGSSTQLCYVMLVVDNLVLVLGNEGGVLIICKVVIHGAYELV